jgi:hypothetical protein
MTGRHRRKDSAADRKMGGTIVALIQTTAAGVSATTGRHTAQDTNAAFGNIAATTMAVGAGMATVIAEFTADAATEATADMA